MESECPKLILLFSGKRKSGKDFLTDKLSTSLNDQDDVTTLKISAPIKSYFAKTFNLNLKELMGTGPYKEKYRSDMIEWSESMRQKDPGIFCREAINMYEGNVKKIWLVSDVRRKTDIQWFKEAYPDIVKTIRINTDESSRLNRGWIHTPAIDNVPSECDLDDLKNWDWELENSDNCSNLNEFITEIISLINSCRQ